jgi:hypothetical protein
MSYGDVSTPGQDFHTRMESRDTSDEAKCDAGRLGINTAGDDPLFLT